MFRLWSKRNKRQSLFKNRIPEQHGYHRYIYAPGDVRTSETKLTSYPTKALWTIQDIHVSDTIPHLVQDMIYVSKLYRNYINTVYITCTDYSPAPAVAHENLCHFQSDIGLFNHPH